MVSCRQLDLLGTRLRAVTLRIMLSRAQENTTVFPASIDQNLRDESRDGVNIFALLPVHFDVSDLPTMS